VASWMQQLPASYEEAHKQLITSLCDWLLPPCLRLVTKYLRQPVPVQEQSLVRSLLRLFEAELARAFAPATDAPPVDEMSLQSVFLFALVWGVGASVDDVSRSEFDAELRSYICNRCGRLAVPRVSDHISDLPLTPPVLADLMSAWHSLRQARLCSSSPRSQNRDPSTATCGRSSRARGESGLKLCPRRR